MYGYIKSRNQKVSKWKLKIKRMNAENFFVFLVGGCKIYKSENKNKKKHAEQFGLYKMHILVLPIMLLILQSHKGFFNCK